MGILNLSASGVVCIYKRVNNKMQLYLTSSNTVLPLAVDIVARSLGNFVIAKIDTLKVYNDSLELATTPIEQYLHPATGQVQFVATFDEASFTGAFNKLALFASNMGQFSELLDIDGVKASDEPISITWTITISQCL